MMSGYDWYVHITTKDILRLESIVLHTELVLENVKNVVRCFTLVAEVPNEGVWLIDRFTIFHFCDIYHS